MSNVAASLRYGIENATKASILISDGLLARNAANQYFCRKKIFYPNYPRKKRKLNYKPLVFGGIKKRSMINKKLFDDPKDAKIARLKMTIEKFKEYDRERKKYYADNMQRLGELESYVQELDMETEIGKLKQTISTLQGQIRKLSKVIEARHIEDNRTEEELSEVITISKLRKNNRHLKEQVDKLIKERSKWITEQILHKKS